MRANISYVPQGNTLMSGTIKENLLLGNPLCNKGRDGESIDFELRSVCV